MEIIKEILQILGILTIPSLAWNIYLYTQKVRIGRFQAELDLKKKYIEWDRLSVRHIKEDRKLRADCEGGLRIRNNVGVNTLTPDDRRRIEELAEEQDRERSELLAEINHFEKILNKELPEISFRDKSKWERVIQKIKNLIKG